MVAEIPRKRLNLAIAPLAALVLGGAVAAAMLAMPADLLEGLVTDSGLPGLLAAAEPPLGITARIALAAVLGGGTGLVAWFALFLMFGTRMLAIAEPANGDATVRRRADAHPDAPPRRPLFANEDLGTPFLEVRAAPAVRETAPMPEPPVASEPAPAPELILPSAAEPIVRPLPTDFDQPLAAFHPAAVPASPAEPLRPPPPLAWTAPRPAPVSPARREPETVHALLERLERGMTRPAPPAPRPEQGLREALESLRRLAADAR